MSRFLRACAVLCALLTSSLAFASAQGAGTTLPIPKKNINFHNGWIEVLNHSGYTMHVVVLSNPIDRAGAAGVQMGHRVWQGDIGGGADLNNCCYAAGSLYLFSKRTSQNPSWPNVYETRDTAIIGSVRPRLCNRDGIPFGYAAVELYENHLVRIDTKCP